MPLQKVKKSNPSPVLLTPARRWRCKRRARKVFRLVSGPGADVVPMTRSPMTRILVVAGDPAAARHIAHQLLVARGHRPDLDVDVRHGHDVDTPLFPRPDAVVVDVGGPGYELDTAWRFRRVLDACHDDPPPVIAVSRLAPQATAWRARRLEARAVVTARDLAQLGATVEAILQPAGIEDGESAANGWDPVRTQRVG